MFYFGLLNIYQVFQSNLFGYFLFVRSLISCFSSKVVSFIFSDPVERSLKSKNMTA